MKKIVLFFAAFLLFLANSQAQNSKLPDVQLKDLQGKTVAFKEQINPEKITVISFWATWCAPCKKELDNIAEIYPEWQEKFNVELIAISTDDARTTPKVKSTVAAKGWDYTVLIDSNQDLQRALNINSVPFTIVIDQKGEIIYQHSGYKDGDEEELAEKLAEWAKK